MEVIVCSWPPPVPVELNTLASLPYNAPEAQSPPVWSRKVRIWPDILPKRVGVPKIMAS
ncbi:Uncharacterised protein [Enterobacter cloacae]|nr:Uncharacterised protein [Enterobacter cloacae]